MIYNGYKEEESNERAEEIKDKDKHRSKHSSKDFEKHRKSHHEEKNRDSYHHDFEHTKRHDQESKTRPKHTDRDRSRSYNSKRDHDRRKRHHKERSRSHSKDWTRHSHSKKDRYHSRKKDLIGSSDKDDQDRDRSRKNERDRSIDSDRLKSKPKKDFHHHKQDRSHSRDHETKKSINRHRDFPKDIDHESKRSRTRSRSILNESLSRRTWRFDSPPKNISNGSSSLNFSDSMPLFNTLIQPSTPNEISKISSGFSPAILLSETQAATNSIIDTNNPNQNTLTNLAAAIGLDANATKAARELYVGNLPPGIDVNQLLEFLNAAMVALKASTMPGNSCNKAWISTDGHYAFVEFRTLEEASNGMQLNGLNCLGYSLRIGRPRTYPPELAALVPQPTAVALDSSYLAQGIAGVRSGIEAASGREMAGSSSDALAAAQKAANIVASTMGFTNFALGGNKVDRMCIMGLPPELPNEKVKSLVTTFGNVKFFQLLLKEDGTSSGVCICDFQDYESQQQAIEILTQNTSYVVMKASDAVDQGLLADFMRLQIQSGDPLLRPQVTTRVIMLCNLVTREELLDETEYEDILEDVRLECANYGIVVSLVIPKPIRGFSEEEVDQSDVGFAFVEFSNTEGSTKARKALSGRKFATRIVEAHYFSEIKYAQKDFKNPSPNYDKEHSSLYNPKLLEAQT